MPTLETAQTIRKIVVQPRNPTPAPRRVGSTLTDDYAVSPAMAGELEQLWRAYRATPSVELRNQLMECYLHLVRYMAERLVVRLSTQVDMDDMIGSGIFGLMDAVENFDPARGWKFETFCLHRVRGAILDSIRDLDWVPRLARRRAGKMMQIVAELQSRLGRKPTREELSRHLGLSNVEFDRFLRDSQPVTMVPFCRRSARPERTREKRESDVVRDPNPTKPYRDLQRDDLRQLFLNSLNKQDRQILELYYYEKMNMKEIGVILGLCESRVSQMHTEIVKTLRRKLMERKDELFLGGPLG